MKLKFKRSGLAAKLVVLALLIYLSISVLNLRGQIQAAEAERDEYQSRVDRQTEENAALSEEIANSGDPQRINDVARYKLGLVEPGEKVFYDITN